MQRVTRALIVYRQSGNNPRWQQRNPVTTEFSTGDEHVHAYRGSTRLCVRIASDQPRSSPTGLGETTDCTTRYELRSREFLLEDGAPQAAAQRSNKFDWDDSLQTGNRYGGMITDYAWPRRGQNGHRGQYRNLSTISPAWDVLPDAGSLCGCRGRLAIRGP